MNHFEKFESYIPLDLLSLEAFLLSNLVVFGFVVARYFGLVYLFYAPLWFKKKTKFTPLHDLKVKPDQIFFEIKWSLIASLIFSLSGYAMGLLWQLGWTQIYLPFDYYGLWYLPLSFIIYGLIHEFYFYYTHLWMHKPAVYKKVHAIHHYSVKTSPWASFSFHPLESMVHAAFLPLMVCLVPIHPVVVIAYLTFMTLSAISNHLGFELMPKALQKHFISGTHHSLHHKKFNGNYGLYFCFIDRLFGTELES